MGAMTSTQMQTELARRVTQVPTGASSAAEAAINRAIRWINRQGSYTFQLSAPVGLTPASVTTAYSSTPTPADFDPGKAFLLLGPNGNAIKQAPVSSLNEALNYNTIGNTDFDTYYLQAAGSGASTLYLFPSITGSPSVTIIYHKVTADVTGSGTSNLPRDFDDLVIDLAEAEEKRIYDVGDAWPQLLARAQDQIRVLLDGYRTQTIETGMDSEAQQVNAEKAQVGRD